MSVLGYWRIEHSSPDNTFIEKLLSEEMTRRYIAHLRGQRDEGFPPLGMNDGQRPGESYKLDFAHADRNPVEEDVPPVPFYKRPFEKKKPPRFIEEFLISCEPEAIAHIDDILLSAQERGTPLRIIESFEARSAFASIDIDSLFVNPSGVEDYKSSASAIAQRYGLIFTYQTVNFTGSQRNNVSIGLRGDPLAVTRAVDEIFVVYEPADHTWKDDITFEACSFDPALEEKPAERKSGSKKR